MNILMLGCSYGVPNYYGPPGDPAETHLEYRLTKAGHTVYNLSLNGGSNFSVFSRLEDYLNGHEVVKNYHKQIILEKPENFKVDLIIWFQTSVLRDYSHSEGTLNERCIDLAHSTYKRLSDIREKLNDPPLIAIGGTAPLYDFFSEYVESVLVIENLLEFLLKQPVPFSHLAGAIIHVLEKAAEKIDILPQELEDANVILDLMANSDLYPDNCHPGGQVHQILFDHISEVINNRLLNNK